MKLMRVMVIMIISPLFLTGCSSISSWWSGKPQTANSTSFGQNAKGAWSGPSAEDFFVKK